MANPPAPPGAKWPEGKVSVGLKVTPDDDPELLRRVSGTGVIEGGDVDAFAKGMWNGPAGWVGLPQFEVDAYHAGAVWMGEGFGKNLVLQGIGKVVGWGLGGASRLLRSVTTIGDDVAVGVQDAITADKALNPVVTQASAAGAAPAVVEGLEAASTAAFRAADDIESFTPKNKHLLSGGSQSKARFATDSVEEVRELVQEALRSPNAAFLPNPNVPGTFRIVTNMGRAIGPRGQQNLRVVVAFDGRVINAFPVHAQ